MAHGQSEVTIDRSADDVWKVLRDFGGIGDVMPGIDKCTVDGDVRTLEMMGMTVKEKLRNLDDDARTVSYSLIESPLGNLESHTATITVTPEGSGSHVTWGVDITPDDLLAIFLPIYEGSTQALKAKLEG